MRSTTRTVLTALAAVAVVGTLPTVLAHGDDGGMDMDMDISAGDEAKPDPDSYPQTYFSYAAHAGVMYAHIILMVISWVLVLPIGLMFSIARSRYTLPTQFLFLATNAVGVLLGINYNANTPDLYPNNAHHKIGWIATWMVSTQVLISLIGRVAGVMGRDAPQLHGKEESQAFIPVSTENMAEHDTMYTQTYRHSNDSGQGTEPNTDSLRSSHSHSTSGQDSPMELRDRRMDYDVDEDLEFKAVELNPPKADSLLAKVAGKISMRAWKLLLFGYNFMDRTMLVLGYIALVTGIVTYGRFFEGHGIFSGLAHWIKGSIFFWYGILTLGRWSGSFGELGWAWNVRPKPSSQKWRPTAEFVEGALIFTYGSTNIFLEHLGNSSKEYSPQDLEHISITVLFIGGGLLAMLIESTNIRDLLNTTVTEAILSQADHAYSDEERAALQAPRQYEFSINPIPAVVILLLGIMMSSHTQQSMISSMVHKQWGNLLTGASFARGLTYVLLYVKPPRSVMPSRPPTELLTAFGLIAGGMIFMASSSDTINGMIHYNLDAMFFYTVTMGFVGLLMAWIVLVLALKGWAVRKEMGHPLQGSWNGATSV
ncbi:uncharacterized protein BCR38DRAFT_348666 [Pseudomassariella vexata]|uniref:Integral membrane protein n=1 Tax=Pseudomassariella vexata TaxID=1141098 RepID=A0A1Y2DNL4_9PEZI|nr:uncharacterized protein BCR38DRAFT_348666 [Pseudomassariella vexata]ORY60726.1 hypothetical protein BCR38DRAFT_348666 [Pseudomassariella vexata]